MIEGNHSVEDNHKNFYTIVANQPGPLNQDNMVSLMWRAKVATDIRVEFKSLQRRLSIKNEQAENEIKQAIATLQFVNTVITESRNINTSEFDNVKKILFQFRSYNKTISLYANAEVQAHQNIDCLHSSAKELLSVTSTSMQIFDIDEDSKQKELEKKIGLGTLIT